MKLTAPSEHQTPNAERRMSGAPAPLDVRCSPIPRSAERAFTMIEVALCLAIIGIALLAIIGVLPLGMNAQRDNREETVIGQDATLLLEAIRSGSRGADDLTNYVYAITNYWAYYNANGSFSKSNANGYAYNGVFVTSPIYTNGPYFSAPITNGANIVALLSTPEFIADVATNYPAVPTLFNTAGYSNRVVAYVRSMSGLAAEKPPQDNPIMRESTFTYRVLCVNAPLAVDTNNLAGFSRQLAGNQRELRLTFMWPQQPNGSLGRGRQTYRSTLAGQLTLTNGFYFYQSQSFTNAP
jgi:prepilin-type N-terminal cleavage/methylation domain-containing protein